MGRWLPANWHGMARKMSDEQTFRLRPRAGKHIARDEAHVWSKSFKKLTHLIRMSSIRRSAKGAMPSKLRPYSQRCAVRVTYSPNRGVGQWAAHGRYIARDSATQSELGKGMGFDADPEPVSVAETLDAWQAAGDERIFKLIISPEFGERIDLQAHTRGLMAQMEHDLGTALKWVAVVHHNTGHPHVHIAMRGVNHCGKALRLQRDYIRAGIRRHAEDL